MTSFRFCKDTRKGHPANQCVFIVSGEILEVQASSSLEDDQTCSQSTDVFAKGWSRFLHVLHLCVSRANAHQRKARLRFVPSDEDAEASATGAELLRRSGISRRKSTVTKPSTMMMKPRKKTLVIAVDRLTLMASMSCWKMTSP
jgi:hypothetical protein